MLKRPSSVPCQLKVTPQPRVFLASLLYYHKTASGHATCCLTRRCSFRHNDKTQIVALDLRRKDLFDTQVSAQGHVRIARKQG